MARPTAGELADKLAADRFAIVPHFFDRVLCGALRDEALAIETDPEAFDAGIGRGSALVRDEAIRITRIRWMDGRTEAQRAFMADAEALRVGLNRTLYLGLETLEAQLALTPIGGYYKRHLDSFRGARNRIVSVVCHLVDDWRPGDGGGLAIWSATGGERDGNPPSVVVPPHLGTLVLMLAEEVPHEVEVTHRPRPSIAGWFRGART